MFYAAREYDASAALADTRRFFCVHCNHECDAMVTGVGQGHGQSPFFLDNGGARDRARDQALGNASANMHFALRGAKCPRCGKHDARPRRYVYLTSIARGLPIGLLLGIAILAMFEGSKSGWVIGIAAAALTASVMTVMRSQRMLTGVFFPSEQRTSTSTRLGL
jgi:hypothetical protein